MAKPIEDESGRYLGRDASDGLPARAVGIWAKEKLNVLQKYMDLFTVGMKPTEKKKFNWNRLVYIDLFAGPGRCIIRDNGEEILGSPLRAMNAQWPFSKLYFVEEVPWAHAALKQRCAKDNRCKVLMNDCNAAVKLIVGERTSDTLYLAFIDPTGLDIHFDTIRALSTGIRCDLIINWYMSALTRNLPHWQEKLESEKLDLFFGTDKWKDSLKKTASARLIFQDWVTLYRSQLKSIGYVEQPEAKKRIQNSKRRDMYWLWFASKNTRGLDFWKKAQKSADPQTLLFDE